LLQLDRGDDKKKIQRKFQKSPPLLKSKSRRNLIQCATSVTLADAPINNLPVSPMTRVQFWPKSDQTSKQGSPDSPQEAMSSRFDSLLKRTIPKIDRDDSEAALKAVAEPRQSAPEYAQSIYVSLLKQECAIGNYFNIKDKSNRFATASQRTCMMRLIMKIHDIMEFKEDSLYIAASIADRYLVNITVHSKNDL